MPSGGLYGCDVGPVTHEQNTDVMIALLYLQIWFHCGFVLLGHRHSRTAVTFAPLPSECHCEHIKSHSHLLIPALS